MNPIRGEVGWGIIGCGDVCEVKSGPAFNRIPHSRLVAVMRRDKDKAEDFARRHHAPFFFDQAEELINHPDVNAIYIATPPSSHEKYTELALRSGKPVYVEKPVSVDASSCQRMLKLSESLDVAVSVAHYRRGLPLFRKVKQLVQAGAIGSVRLVRLNTLQSPDKRKQENWRVDSAISGGGLFNDLSPHQLDILFWIFGPPEKVSGFSSNQSGYYNTPDLTVLNAVFPGGVVAQGAWSFSVSDLSAEDKCEIIGDKGRLFFSFFKPSTIEMVTESGADTLEFDFPVHIQEPMILAVNKYFRGEGPNPCSLKEAFEVMKMIDEAR
jgi:1,5-anhydro-D-fructose reductase (1,5-anhydro-D-mannitol-forming)